MGEICDQGWNAMDAREARNEYLDDQLREWFADRMSGWPKPPLATFSDNEPPVKATVHNALDLYREWLWEGGHEDTMEKREEYLDILVETFAEQWEG